MIHGGYVLQPRSFDGSEASHFSPVVRELWFYLLRKVNYADNGKYKRGQGFFCLSDIQNDMSWFVGYRKKTYSKPQLTKALRRLREGNMIATMKATRGIIVTICNYIVYQNPDNYESNDEESMKETRRKREGRTKNKKGKKEEGKEVKPLDSDFENLWNIYPKKDGKKDALRHFKASVTTMEKLTSIRVALDNYIASRKGESHRYTKAGSTWFNNWEDWIAVEDQKQDTQSWPEFNPKTGTFA